MECKSEPGVSQGSPPTHTQTQTHNPVMMLFFAGAVFPPSKHLVAWNVIGYYRCLLAPLQHKRVASDFFCLVRPFE